VVVVQVAGFPPLWVAETSSGNEVVDSAGFVLKLIGRVRDCLGAPSNRHPYLDGGAEFISMVCSDEALELSERPVAFSSSRALRRCRRWERHPFPRSIPGRKSSSLCS